MQDVLEPILKTDKFSSTELNQLNQQFETTDPGEILSWVYETFGTEMVLGTGFGSSGVFLIHQLQTYGIDIPVFYLDTNLLFDSTYELKDRIEARYNIDITRVTPELSLKKQADRFGDELWKRNPNQCCFYRKVLPLRNYLSDKKAWVTGIRRSQSDTRNQVRIVDWDEENDVIKINPVAHWSGKKIWDEIHRHNLPYNPMHDEGYPSIGCIPCTQPVNASKESDDRNGRWNGTDKTECGIHFPEHYKNGS
ncbi:phosphoadenylyl-sulfate reductase [Rhodohalobacter sulfatireducens]|uniref:Adenosine 5'-phosphosulfate reductase n=1 Tax=Rhodohalobacter sulfatireducens TaxID=2911366 RepID=A0ABS9KER0_9BACT|nr:phosphoadenylyl-sulfate reductase [Rhodohalobacter sulfatireducens]MCG2589346.1 phosphoadenylyl-sulfate reductase [Rhodohalobacter sulfatireducens]